MLTGPDNMHAKLAWRLQSASAVQNKQFAVICSARHSIKSRWEIGTAALSGVEVPPSPNPRNVLFILSDSGESCVHTFLTFHQYPKPSLR